MRAVAIGLFLAASLTSSFGQDAPWVGQMSEVSGHGSMAYDCLQSGGTLSCHFTQVRLSKPDVLTPSQIEEQATKLAAVHPKEKECQQYRDVLNRIRTGEPVEGVTTDEERNDAAESILNAVAFCERPGLETARALIAAGNDRNAVTCHIGTFPFDLDFEWNAITDRWDTVSQPNGPCGVLTAAHMEIDKEDSVKAFKFWTYSQETLVTKRDGEDPLFGKCSERPNETMQYTWRSRAELLQCRFIEYKLF